uniref:Uncharacterized protein n=1 Tax=Arundo donax TaxID=35708 RepID=A0A0A9DR38_ARUDO
MGYSTWICFVAFFHTSMSLRFSVVKLLIQAYSLHKAGGHLRFAYVSSTFGLICFVMRRSCALSFSCVCQWHSSPLLEDGIGGILPFFFLWYFVRFALCKLS